MSPQISLYYIIVIQFGGVNLELCLEGLSPRNPPRCDGSASLPLLRRPWICILCQQTSPKCWFANVNMKSYFDVTNSVYPVTMTTIRNCSILEFGRGASNQAVAPGITRPPHATGVKNVSVTLWFCLQRRCKTFCFVCFYQPALCRKCVFVLWTSCLRAKMPYYYYFLLCQSCRSPRNVSLGGLYISS